MTVEVDARSRYLSEGWRNSFCQEERAKMDVIKLLICLAKEVL